MMSVPGITVDRGSVAAWALAIRPRTLPASAAPVVLGWAAAASAGPAQVHLGLVCLGAALTLQIAANLANDLFDALTGVDSADRLGPVRVTQSGLLRPGQVTAALAACLLLAAGLGLYAVWHVGPWLLVLGAACVVGAFAYTSGPVPLARLGLGEAAALFFFGPVACAGTFAVLHGSVTATALTAGLMPGFHAAAIMAVNNLRDIESDARAGKFTLAVRLGEKRARLLAVAMLLSGNLIAAPLALASGRAWPLLGLLLVPAAAPLLRAMVRTPRSAELNTVLARTGQWGLLTATFAALLLHL